MIKFHTKNKCLLKLQTYLQDAEDICNSEDAEVLHFSNDAQVSSFLKLIDTGNNLLVYFNDVVINRYT